MTLMKYKVLLWKDFIRPVDNVCILWIKIFNQAFIDIKHANLST
jgi:hypothetical protein